jgi:hypothetical protein
MVSRPSAEEILSVLGILEANPFEDCEDAWLKSLGLLRLNLTYVPAIQKVLGQGHWRKAPSALAYIRKAAVREASRMGLLDLTGRDPKRELIVSDFHLMDEEDKPVPHDEAIDRLRYDSSDQYRHDYPEFSPVWGVSDSLLAESGVLEIDWDQVAELAGLDAGEKLVIQVRLDGLGREQAFQSCHTEEDRRMLQAAWKRFERHQDALKATLESGEPHRARRIYRNNPEPPMKMVVVRTRKGPKISFRKLVPLVPK